MAAPAGLVLNLWLSHRLWAQASPPQPAAPLFRADSWCSATSRAQELAHEDLRTPCERPSRCPDLEQARPWEDWPRKPQLKSPEKSHGENRTEQF